jgi:exoribonuclease R
LDTSNKLFNATVVSLHDFGIFAELDEYGIDGLIPASKMPQKMTTEAMSSAFP